VNRGQVKWIAIVWLALSVQAMVILWLTAGLPLAVVMAYFMALPIIMSGGVCGLRYPAMALEWLFPKIMNIWRFLLGIPKRP
jgi:hypothetical protein